MMMNVAKPEGFYTCSITKASLLNLYEEPCRIHARLQANMESREGPFVDYFPFCLRRAHALSKGSYMGLSSRVERADTNCTHT